MANKTDKISPFRLVAGLIGLLLVAAAALFYGQASGGNNGSSSALAAVSQSIPLAAIAAVDGENGAFDRLQAGRSQLQNLKQASVGLPGADSDWQRLEQGAAAILDLRAGIEQVTAARDALEEHSDALLEGADRLLAESGSTTVIQEFQRRALGLDPALRSLARSGDRQRVADAIQADLEYMRQVIDGLGGAASRLDVTALDGAAREATLVPLTGVFADVEQRVSQGLQDIDALDGVDAELDALRLAASSLYDSEFSSESGSMLPGFLSNPMIPLVMLGMAAIMLGVLLLLHRKSGVFERTAREQAAQNERNQQAILRLLDELGSLADGDLTVEATVTEDITGAIADSINYAIEKLRELVATINQTSIMVDSAAKQTESTAVHMARAAETQSGEIAAATESIVSMAGSIEEVSGNAERSSDVARHSVEVAHKGGEAVRRTIDGMNTIRETIQDTSKRIKRLGESSQEIGNIVELINDIAEQTNILALERIHPGIDGR